MECCLPILCSSRKGSRLIPHALKCILYWWITIYDSRWYICVHVCVYMCVCACKCIYLKVAIWHYVHPNMAKEKSSELEKVLFLLVSFYQKIEKVIHFHLSYFLSSPLFFFGTCPQLSKIHLTSVQPMLMNLMEIRYYSLWGRINPRSSIKHLPHGSESQCEWFSIVVT